MHTVVRRLTLSTAALAAACAFQGAAAMPAAADVSVTVNGRPADFAPPPIVRAGRVFVPLRGVFERLGASVVYQNGTINATRGPVTVSLQIGSTQATVSGQQQMLDVAPFIVGASTYVPLRFVSQSLGADVQYDGANQIVAISTRYGGSSRPMPNEPPPAPPAAIALVDQRPERDATVQSTRPTISADFSGPVDPNTVRVTLDGLDVTDSSTRSQTGFVFEPPSPLQSTTHVVRVTGRLRDGSRFARTWSFTSGTSAPQNVLRIERPGDGDAVDAGNFTVRGRTMPNARVRVIAGSVVDAGGPFAFGAGNFNGDTTADGDGRFELQVTLRTVPGARIGMTIVSTDPQTREGIQRKLTLRAN